MTMTQTHVAWRKATSQEIAAGQDDPVNKGMVKILEEEVEVPDPEPPIDISQITDEQILELKERLDNITP